MLTDSAQLCGLIMMDIEIDAVNLHYIRNVDIDFMVLRAKEFKGQKSALVLNYGTTY